MCWVQLNEVCPFCRPEEEYPPDVWFIWNWSLAVVVSAQGVVGYQMSTYLWTQ